MKKVLFLSHVPPYPAVGGDRLRISQSLRLLCELYDVDIAFISHNPAECSVAQYLPPSAREVCFCVKPVRRYLQAARTPANALPSAVNHFYHKPLQRWIDGHIGNYDMVFCASPVMAHYLRRHKGVRKVLDMTDSLTMNYRNAAGRAHGLRKRFYLADAKRMEAYERQTSETFDSVAYIAAADRDYVPGGRKYIVGNAVRAVGEADRCVHNPLSRNIVFVGKMDYEPNVLAVDFFARKVMPLLNKKLDNPYRFQIVGACPVPAVTALASLPHVEVTGFVDSVTPYYRDAAVVVAPMLSGSGVQNKILQALAHGCCVTTTPTGFEGIESLADVMTVIEPAAELWADTLASMLADRKKMAATGIRAAERVIEEYGIDSVRRQFRDFVNAS